MEIISHALNGVLTVLIIIGFGFVLELPQPIFVAFRYIGSMTSPLAMLFIGIAMSKTNWQEIRLGK